MNCGATYHIESICLLTISERFSEWPSRITPSTESDSETS